MFDGSTVDSRYILLSWPELRIEVSLIRESFLVMMMISAVMHDDEDATGHVSPMDLMIMMYALCAYLMMAFNVQCCCQCQ